MDISKANLFTGKEKDGYFSFLDYVKRLNTSFSYPRSEFLSNLRDRALNHEDCETIRDFLFALGSKIGGDAWGVGYDPLKKSPIVVMRGKGFGNVEVRVNLGLNEDKLTHPIISTGAYSEVLSYNLNTQNQYPELYNSWIKALHLIENVKEGILKKSEGEKHILQTYSYNGTTIPESLSLRFSSETDIKFKENADDLINILYKTLISAKLTNDAFNITRNLSRLSERRISDIAELLINGKGY